MSSYIDVAKNGAIQGAAATAGSYVMTNAVIPAVEKTYQAVTESEARKVSAVVTGGSLALGAVGGPVGAGLYVASVGYAAKKHNEDCKTQ